VWCCCVAAQLADSEKGRVWSGVQHGRSSCEPALEGAERSADAGPRWETRWRCVQGAPAMAFWIFEPLTEVDGVSKGVLTRKLRAPLRPRFPAV
jgi:hypothetical protein